MSDRQPTGEREPGLTELLERATDRIEPPGLARAVRRDTQLRRTRTAVLITVGAVAAATAVVSGVVSIVRSDDPPPPATHSTTAPPTTTPTAVPEPPAVDPDAIKQRWDPFTVEQLGVTGSNLPADLDPPDDPPPLDDQPISAAIVAWPEQGRDLRLLGPGGEWRSVPGTADAVTWGFSDTVAPALTPDGRQVAMATDDGVLIVDVTTGDERTIAWPGPLEGPFDTMPDVRWTPDADGVLVLHWRRPWVVPLAGDPYPAPYGGGYGTGLAVDPQQGAVIDRDDPVVTVWGDGQVRSRAADDTWGQRHAAGHGLLAFTGGRDDLPRAGGPIVMDPSTGEILAYAPIRDRLAVYSDNGYLTAQGFLDDHTVLLLVAPMDFKTMELGEETWHLVAWDFRADTYQRLSSGGTRMRGIAVAPGLVR